MEDEEEDKIKEKLIVQKEHDLYLTIPNPLSWINYFKKTPKLAAKLPEKVARVVARHPSALSSAMDESKISSQQLPFLLPLKAAAPSRDCSKYPHSSALPG